MPLWSSIIYLVCIKGTECSLFSDPVLHTYLLSQMAISVQIVTGFESRLLKTNFHDFCWIYSEIVCVLFKRIAHSNFTLRIVLNHDHGWVRSLYLPSPNGKCISVMSKHVMVPAVYQGPILTLAKHQMWAKIGFGQ